MTSALAFMFPSVSVPTKFEKNGTGPHRLASFMFNVWAEVAHDVAILGHLFLNQSTDH